MADDGASTPQGILKDSDLNTYSAGIPTDNPILKFLSILSQGNQYLPRPDNKQDVFDAFIQRDRSQNFLKIQSSDAFTNNQLFRQFGVNPNSDVMRMVGLAAGGPNDQAMRMLSPLIGGNPVAAQMQMYAGFTGQTMGAFGRMDNVGFGETQRARQALDQSFYNWKPFDKDKANKSVLDDLKQQFSGADGTKTLKERYGINPDQLTEKFVRSYKPQVDMDDPSVGGVINQTIDQMNHIAGSNNFQGTDAEVLQKKKDAIVARYEQLSKDLTGSKVDKKILDKIKENIDKTKNATSVQDMGDADNLLKYAADANADPMLKGKRMFEGNDKMPQRVIDGINYANSRGFNYEDFSSASIAAADLRMTGAPQHDIAKYETNFMKNAGGAMSAARSVLGNDKSGAELTQGISNMFGTESPDMSSEAGAKKVEDLFRNMKAASKLAGASIDSIMGIIKEGQMLAQSKPGLQYMSGAVTAEITQRALQSTTAMNTIMGSEAVRREGGAQGMVGQTVSEGIRLAGTDASKQTAALYSLYKDDPESVKKIQDWAAGKYKDMPSTELSQAMLIQDLAQNGKVKRSATRISMYVNDPNHQAMDMSDPTGARLGQSAAGQVAVDKYMLLEQTAHGGKDKLQADMMAAYKANPQDPVRALSDMTQNGNAEQVLSQYGNTLTDAWMYKNVPEYKTQKDKAASLSKQYATDAATISKKMDYLNAPMITQVAQKVFNGDVSRDGLSAIFDPFMSYDKNGAPKTATDAQKAEMETRKGHYYDFLTGVQRADTGDPAAREDKIKGLAVKFAEDEGTTAFDGYKGDKNEIANRADRILRSSRGLDDIKSKISAMTDKGSTDEDQRTARFLQDMGVTTNQDAFLAGHDKGLEGLAQSRAEKYRADATDQIFQKDYDDLNTTTSEKINNTLTDPSMKNNQALLSIKKVFSGKDGKFDIKRYTQALNNGNLNEMLNTQGGYKGTADSEDYKKATDALSQPADAANQILEKMSVQKASKDSELTSNDLPGIAKKILDSIGTDLPASIDKLTQAFTGVMKG